MTVRSAPVWREALALLSIRLVLAQLGLAVGVLASFLVWVRLPDASVPEVAGSFLLALLVVAAAGIGECCLVLGLAERPRNLARLMRGTLVLFAGIALWFAWSAWLAHLGAHDPMRAGYLNSQAPHQLRNLLTFEHILLWLGWIWNTIRWIGAGFIAAFVFAWTVAEHPRRAIAGTLRSPSFWLALVGGTTAATLSTGALMSWIPLHGLWPEMFSLGLRLAVATLFDTAILCWLLATLSVCLRRAEASYDAP